MAKKSKLTKKLEMDNIFEIKLEIYKKLENKLKIYNYFKLKIFEVFLSMVDEVKC